MKLSMSRYLPRFLKVLYEQLPTIIDSRFSKSKFKFSSCKKLLHFPLRKQFTRSVTALLIMSYENNVVWLLIVNHRMRSRRIDKYNLAMLYLGILYDPCLAFKSSYKLPYSFLGTINNNLLARMYSSVPGVWHNNRNNG